MSKGKWIILLLAIFTISVSVETSISTKAFAAKISKEELEKAKKEGDAQAQTEKMRESYGKEGAEGNVESQEYKTTVKGSGKSTYGVVGFDYLTGIGKMASTVEGTKQGKNNPMAAQIKKRWAGKWSAKGKVGESRSGWGKETGVTEAFDRGIDESELGADYNAWANQWNSPTRPETATGETLVKGADPAQGAHYFSFYCVHCHGWSGKGDGPTAAMLDPRPRNQTNGKYMNHISNLEIFTVIKGGGAARNLSEAMPPWGNVLQDQDIWNIVAFLRAIAKPAFDAESEEGAVTSANADDSSEFKDLNEQLELEGIIGGRGSGMTGGYSSPGGGRLASTLVGVKTKSSAKDKSARTGDQFLEHRTSVGKK